MGLLRRIFLNEWVIVAAVLANAMVLFMMGFEGLSHSQFLLVVDHLFTFFFLTEVFVKVSTLGWKKYIGDSWNKFDFTLVMISLPSVFEVFVDIPDVSFLLALRLLRVFRILRFMRFIPNIGKMFSGIQRAFRASVFIFVALLIYNILLAVISTYLFKDVAPEFFKTPFHSMYTIFQIFTMEGWNEIPSTVVQNSEIGSFMASFAKVYFLFVVLTGSILGFGIVNAIFVDEMTMDNNDALESKVDILMKKVDLIMKERGLELPPDEPPADPLEF